jgi:outer membrane protein TolC
MKGFVTTVLVLAFAAPVRGQITWRRCQASARENYPLIRQYGLIERSTDYSVAAAAKAWLPQVSLAAQASYQSDVASFPPEMDAMFEQVGVRMQGLNREQYRLSLEVGQTLWDGGRFRAQQEAARAEGELSRQQLEVEVYALRERVSSLYFGILMLSEELVRNTLLGELLQSNLRVVEGCIEHGAATESDRQAVQVELSAAAQQRVRIESMAAAYRRMLSVMTGLSIGEADTLETPPVQPLLPATAVGNRPELHLFEAQRQQLEVRKRALHVSVMPRIGLFAQGFYGNPGLNLFRDMTENRPTWNYLAGIRFRWDFGGLYTQKEDRQKLSLARLQVDSRQETFLFNRNLERIRLQEAVDRTSRILEGDDEIIALRTSIRRTSETRFAHGTLTVGDLLRDIHAENQARQARALHEIERMKHLYDLLDTIHPEL